MCEGNTIKFFVWCNTCPFKDEWICKTVIKEFSNKCEQLKTNIVGLLGYQVKGGVTICMQNIKTSLEAFLKNIA